jgi:predicted branched-subunit amino acid permease
MLGGMQALDDVTAAGPGAAPAAWDLTEHVAGARAVFPLAVIVAVLGLPFGVLAASAGFTPLAVAALSATTFAGSAQLAAVSVVAAGGALGAAVGAASLLNARYVAMGLALAPALRGPLWRRLLLVQLAVDEAWAVAYVGAGRFSEARLVGAGLTLYVAHVGATALGAVSGERLGDSRALGLDAAFPALFLTLLRPHVERGAGRAAALLGAALALLLTPLTPPGTPIVAAAAAALLGLRAR